MPHPTQLQTERQNAIREILQHGAAATQQSVVEALTARGFEATQSSVSRDLKEIGALKTPAGYTLGEATPDGMGGVAEVANLIRGFMPAGPHLLVIHTAVGGAQRVALALDRAGWPEIVGNIGGDDTVFAATPSAPAQRNLITRLERATRG